MTMAMRAQPAPSEVARALRVGVVRDGKIIDEHIFRQPERVRVGSAEANELMLDGSTAGASFTLFERKGDTLYLCFSPEMRGRVGGAGGLASLEELRQHGRTKERDGVHRLRLDPHSRGKLVLGDTSLLFQMIVPPPITPRPALPASVRGGFIAAIDWLFTASVVLAYASFFAGVVYLENADWPLTGGLDTVPDAVAQMIFAEPEPPHEPDVVAPPEPSVVADNEQPSTPPEHHASNTPSAHPHASPHDAPAMTSDAQARIVADAQHQAEMLILGALARQQGSLRDVLAPGAVTVDAEEVFRQVNGVRVAQRGEADTLHDRTGGTPTGHLEPGFLHPVGDTHGVDEGPEIIETVIVGQVHIPDGGGDTGGIGDMPADVVTRTIQQRVRAIQRCYEIQLAHQANLEGKVTVAFTVVERGTVSRARVTENTSHNEALGRCVSETIGRLRFNPGPQGGSVDFSYPFVFAPQH